jgi:fatty-acyl-CoA synthase
MSDYSLLDELTLGELLERAAKEYPHKDALIYRGERVSYKQFNGKVSHLASEFRRIGVTKGDRCAVMLPNSVEAIYAQYAIFKLGAVFSALSTRFRKVEISSALKHSGAKMLVTIDEFKGTNFLKLIQEIRSDLDSLSIVVVKSIMKYPDTYDLGALLQDDGQGSESAGATVQGGEIASIMYTSGSTGTPKGVTATHQNHVWDAVGVNERLSISEKDAYLVMLPLSHNFACIVLLTDAILAGSTIVIMDGFEAAEALDLIERHRVSVLYGVPTMFVMMLDQLRSRKYRLSSLRTGYMSGASCPVELVRAVMEEMGCKISVGYGMTECGCICITEYTDDEYVKAETVGRPIRNVQIRIVDKERREVPGGAVGEITVKGENVFKGYYKAPDLDKEVFDAEGWFYTGDLGLKDANGRYRIAGRRKEMIIRGGFNVYPAEVERQILLLEGVKYTAVLGIPDERLGEKICACVVFGDGYKPSKERVTEICKENLANYKVPDYVEIMEAFPMTSGEKIQKYKLQEMMVAKYGKEIR